MIANTTTTAVIKYLTDVFSIFGLPETIVSDNGVQFKSSEFEQWCKAYNIKHIGTATYHPASNGCVERFNGTLKGFIHKNEGISDAALAKFLLTYRNTPHRTTARCPSELLLGRRARLLFDTIFTEGAVNREPENEARWRPVETKAHQRQDEQAIHHPSRKHFRPGDEVWARNYRGNKRWVEATVKETGRRNCTVDVEGELWKRHVDQLRPRRNDCSAQQEDLPDLPVRTRQPSAQDRRLRSAGRCGIATEADRPIRD